MNIETLDFGDLIKEQKDNPQQTQYEENNLIETPTKEEQPVLEEKKERLYPLGTVVMLKGGKKRLMVVGFTPLNDERTNKAYDYIGCLFPEGLLATDKLAMFNHNQIEKVYQEGLCDEEEIEFKDRLEEFFDSLN